MEIIDVPRAFGKTTNLIMRAVKTGYPIIVGTSSQKNVLKDQIRKITDKEVDVYTIFDFCELSNTANHLSTVLSTQRILCR